MLLIYCKKYIFIDLPPKNKILMNNVKVWTWHYRSCAFIDVSMVETVFMWYMERRRS